MSDAISGDDLIRAVTQVFSSMLGLELTYGNGNPPDFPPERKVSASVGISGEWNGAVMLECSTSTACVIAGAMLGDAPEKIDEDVKDIMAEITNIVAGNFKNSLPGHSTLTLPCVIEGSDYSMEIIQGKKVFLQPLLCDGKGVIFSVIQANGARR